MYSIKLISTGLITFLLVACGGGNGGDNKDRVRIISEERYFLENVYLSDLADPNIVAELLQSSNLESESEFNYDGNGNITTINWYSINDNERFALESTTTHEYEFSNGQLTNVGLNVVYYDNFTDMPYVDYQSVISETWQNGLIRSDTRNSQGLDQNQNIEYETQRNQEYIYTDNQKLATINYFGNSESGQNDFYVDFEYDISGPLDYYQITYADSNDIYTREFSYNEKNGVTSTYSQRYDSTNNEISYGRTTYYSFDKDFNIMVEFSLLDSEIENGYADFLTIRVQYFEETERCDAREEQSKTVFPYISVPYCLDKNTY